MQVAEALLQRSRRSHSPAAARQVTLNENTPDDELTDDLLDALESSAREGGIVLQSEGLFLEKNGRNPVTLQFDGAAYADIDGARRDLDFAPRTGIEEGLGRFVAWYRDYHGL